MKTLTILLLCCASGLVTAARQQATATAVLKTVTVYTRGAELYHQAQVRLPAGNSEVRVHNIANMVDESSIRVGADANITILSVSFSKDYTEPKEKSKAYLQLEDSVAVLERRLKDLAGEQQTAQSVLDVLERNGTIAGTNTQTNVSELEKMLDFYTRKQSETKQKLGRLAELVEKYTEAADRLKQQMAELTADQDQHKGQLVLQLMAEKPATAALNISYLCPNAGWSAFYDLRSENTSAPLMLAYKASISQSTGIDWEKVKLTLTTGIPQQNGTAPLLSPWFLLYKQPQELLLGKAIDRRSYTGTLATVTAKDIARRPVGEIISVIDGDAPGVHATSGGGQPGAGTDILMRGVGSVGTGAAPLVIVDGTPYEGALSSIDPARVAAMTFLKEKEATGLYGSRGQNGVVVITTRNGDLSQYTTLREQELNASFEVALPYDIASNAQPHSVLLQQYDVPVYYHYFAAPRSSTQAFLTAGLSDYSRLNLLPGMANIIFEHKYIGKSAINPLITGDTLSISMGPDSRIVVNREKVAELSGTKMIGNSRRQSYTYEIRVRNGKREAIELTLKDQFPIVTDKDMEVSLLETAGAEVNHEAGMLTWNLRLAPGETRTLRFGYSVKYPGYKILANL